MILPQVPSFRSAFVAVAALMLGVALVGGCAEDDDDDDFCSDEVKSAVDDDADFASYETFAIFEVGTDAPLGGAPATIPDDVVANIDTANRAVKAELKDLGLSEVDPDDEEPDLWIMSAALTEEEEGIYWQCVPGWYWWGWYYYWDPCAWLDPVEFEYTVGTLLVGVVDSKDNVPVFGGVVKGVLECTDDVDQRIVDGVDEIFEDYPTE